MNQDHPRGKIHFLSLLLIVFCVHLSAIFSHADNVTVCKEGSPPCDYTSIKEALQNTSTGDTITVKPSPEIYNESDLIVVGKTLQTENPALKGSVTIDASGSGNPVISGAADAEIKGFTIKGGNATGSPGGGIRATGGPIILDNLIIEYNTSNSAGGGVGTNHGSNVTIKNCTIRENSAPVGGGVYNWGGDFIISENTKIENNYATGNAYGEGNGGGVFSSYYSTIHIENSTISDNRAQGWISNNGGGLWIGGDTAELANVKVSSNNAEPGSNGSSGGGIYMSSNWNIRISGGSISGNSASSGGGMYLSPGSPAVVYLATGINGNATTMPVGSGGGLFCSGPDRISTLTGSISGNNPDDIVNCGSSFVPPTGTTRTAADNKQSGDSNDPINTFTGELFNQYDPDISLGGPMPLSFARYYSSGFKQADILANMGDNWRHNFDWKLMAIGLEMHIVDHQGRTIQFEQNGLAWALVGKTDIPYQIVENTGSYTLLDPQSQRSYVFNSAGQLTSIADGHGNEHTLSYTSGPLTQISDGLGRVLNFTYNANNYLSSVDDGLGREVSFTYTDSYLTGVTDLMGYTTEYDYSTAHDNHLGMGLLISTIRPAGNTPFDQLVGVYSAAYNPQDGELYGLIRETIAEGGGLYGITGPSKGVLLQAYDRPAHVLFTDDGDAFISEDYAGVVNRLEWQGSSSVWVSGFHDNDDDPFGMTIAPPGFNGPNVSEGDILVSDRGSGGPNQVYSFSPDTSEGEQLVWDYPGIDEPDFFDLAASPDGTVYTSDYLDSNSIYTLEPDGTMIALPLSESILNMGSIVYDDEENVIYVASSETMSVYRIDPATGLVVLVSSGFTNLRPGCLEIDPPTRRLWVTDNGSSRIYEISLQAEDSDKLGDIITYNYTQTWNDSLKVANQTDSEGNTFSFDYSSLDTIITDPLGNSRTHTHTVTGELSDSADRTGQNIAIGSDAEGHRNTITDRLGDVTTMSYHLESGKLASKTNADSTSSSFNYTARPVGDNTAYDLTGIIHADTATESFAYDASGNMTSHTDQAGNVSSFTYNASGQPLTITNKAGGVTTNTYNPDATVATTEDPVGNTTSFGYDALKRMNLITFHDTSTAGFTYDNADRLLTISDENSHTTTLSYDLNGNLAAIDDALLNTISFTYDGNDRLLSITDAESGVTSRTYDQLGRTATFTDANNNVTTLGYDIHNRLTSVTDPLDNVWASTYDLEGIIASRTDPLNNTTNYVSDKMGRITQITSPLGNITQIGYDSMGRIISTTDPLTQTTTFNRDSRGLLSGIDLPGGIISSSYTRNNLGDITQITDPNGHNWQSTFNNQGLRTSRTDPLDNTQTMTYDSRNRPAAITYPDGTVRTLGYDLAGNLISSSYSGSGLVFNYTYDDNNRLLSANDGPGTPDTLIQNYDKAGRISNSNGIVIGRDAGGRIINMTLAESKTVTYAYDANDNLISVTDWAGATTIFSYDDAGRLISIDRPAANGVDTSYTYDDDSRLVGVDEDRGATAISNIALVRDASGRVTKATRDTPNSASAVSLSSITNSYDNASQIATSGFVYDARGRLTNDGARTYIWDDASRLTSVTQGATTTTYTYDAMRQRLSHSSDGVVRKYLWNTALGLNSISIERDGDGEDLCYFIHTPSGALLYSIDAISNARQFYHFDEMGNTITVTDDSGSIISSYAYTPYGKLTTPTDGLDNPFKWQGQFGVMDEGNGLYYVRARYYDRDAGQFISRDQLHLIFPKEVNPYQYALNNPMHLVDVTGRDSVLPELTLPPASTNKLLEEWGMPQSQYEKILDCFQNEFINRIDKSLTAPVAARVKVSLVVISYYHSVKRYEDMIESRWRVVKDFSKNMNYENTRKVLSLSRDIQLKLCGNAIQEIDLMKNPLWEKDPAVQNELNQTPVDSVIDQLTPISKRESSKDPTNPENINDDQDDPDASSPSEDQIDSVVPELEEIVTLC